MHTSIVLPDDPADMCLDGNSLSHFIAFVSIFVSLYFMNITPFYHTIKQSIDALYDFAKHRFFSFRNCISNPRLSSNEILYASFFCNGIREVLSLLLHIGQILNEIFFTNVSIQRSSLQFHFEI